MNTVTIERNRLANLAMQKAAERDNSTGFRLLRMSPKRWAIIRLDHLNSWVRVGDDGDDLPSNYLTTLSAWFVEDEEGKPMKNLTWVQARAEYERLVNEDLELQGRRSKP